MFTSLRRRFPFGTANRKPAKHSRRSARRCRQSMKRLEDRSLVSAGDLDLTFGTGGTVTTDTNEWDDSAGSVCDISNKVMNGVFELAVTLLIVAAFTVPGRVQLIINEIDPDNVGADTIEFVELLSSGTSGMSMYGYVVVFFNGNNDTSYAAFDLDGHQTGPAGFFLLANAPVIASGGIDIVFPNNTLQNGPDAVALYSANAADFPNGTAVTSTNLIDAIVYGGSGAGSAAGLLAVFGAFQSTVPQDTSVIHASIGRVPDGAYDDWHLKSPPDPIGSGIPKGIDGDYNLDGTVRATDYVLWRKSPHTFGGDPDGYNTWRANFGRTLLAGSGAALPSAESLSAAVPEPATLWLACAGVKLRGRYRTKT